MLAQVRRVLLEVIVRLGFKWIIVPRIITAESRRCLLAFRFGFDVGPVRLVILAHRSGASLEVRSDSSGGCDSSAILGRLAAGAVDIRNAESRLLPHRLTHRVCA